MAVLLKRSSPSSAWNPSLEQDDPPPLVIDFSATVVHTEAVGCAPLLTEKGSYRWRIHSGVQRHLIHQVPQRQITMRLAAKSELHQRKICKQALCSTPETSEGRGRNTLFFQVPRREVTCSKQPLISRAQSSNTRSVLPGISRNPLIRSPVAQRNCPTILSLSFPLHSDVLHSKCSWEAKVLNNPSKKFQEYYSGTFVIENLRKKISTINKFIYEALSYLYHTSLLDVRLP